MHLLIESTGIKAEGEIDEETLEIRAAILNGFSAHGISKTMAIG